MCILPISTSTFIAKQTYRLSDKLKDYNYKSLKLAGIIARFIFYPICFTLLTPFFIFYNTCGILTNGILYLIASRITHVIFDKNSQYYLKNVNKCIAFAIKDFTFGFFFSQMFWFIYTFSPRMAIGTIKAMDEEIFKTMGYTDESANELSKTNVTNNVLNIGNLTLIKGSNGQSNSQITITLEMLKAIHQMNKIEFKQFIEKNNNVEFLEKLFDLLNNEKKNCFAEILKEYGLTHLLKSKMPKIESTSSSSNPQSEVVVEEV